MTYDEAIDLVETAVTLLDVFEEARLHIFLHSSTRSYLAFLETLATIGVIYE